MSYRAIIHDLSTGDVVLRCDVEGHDLHEAENAALSKAALSARKHPSEMEVRHLHEFSAIRHTTAAWQQHAGSLIVQA